MRNKKLNYRKIGQTSIDKVNGKLVKYRRGDCLSISYADDTFLAVLVSEKFNKYYDLTFIEYLSKNKPTVDDFNNGRFFGCYREDQNKAYPTLHKNMMLCSEVDSNLKAEKVGSVDLIENLEMTSYGYETDMDGLRNYYLADLPQRGINTINFDKHPDIIFLSARFIEMTKILKTNGR